MTEGINITDMVTPVKQAQLVYCGRCGHKNEFQAEGVSFVACAECRSVNGLFDLNFREADVLFDAATGEFWRYDVDRWKGH